MRRYPASLLISAALIAGCQQSPPVDYEARVLALADAYYEHLLDYNPLLPLYVDIDRARHDRLPDRSPQAFEKLHAFEDSLLVEVRLIDSDALTRSGAWITHGVLVEELEASIETRICRKELWNVNQMGGWQGSIRNIARRQPIGTNSLRHQALERYGRIPAFIDQEIENLRTGLDEGFSAPRSVVERVIDQISGVLDFELGESPLLGPANRDSNEVFAADLTTLVADVVFPRSSAIVPIWQTNTSTRPAKNRVYRAFPTDSNATMRPSAVTRRLTAPPKTSSSWVPRPSSVTNRMSLLLVQPCMDCPILRKSSPPYKRILTTSSRVALNSRRSRVNLSHGRGRK